MMKGQLAVFRIATRCSKMTYLNRGKNCSALSRVIGCEMRPSGRKETSPNQVSLFDGRPSTDATRRNIEREEGCSVLHV